VGTSFRETTRGKKWSGSIDPDQMLVLGRALVMSMVDHIVPLKPVGAPMHP